MDGRLTDMIQAIFFCDAIFSENATASFTFTAKPLLLLGDIAMIRKAGMKLRAIAVGIVWTFSRTLMICYSAANAWQNRMPVSVFRQIIHTNGRRWTEPRRCAMATREFSFRQDQLSATNSGTDGVVKQRFDNALRELESHQLYGRSPKLLSIEGLAGWVTKGKLTLNPNYQRGYVWEQDRASRLVVTVLCNRLAPGIVLHEREKGKYEVVDGKQRLTTLISFFLASQETDSGSKGYSTQFIKLGKLDENYDALNGLTFDDLSEERQNVYENYDIACSIIPHTATKEDVFSCYEDINSGGEDLSAQQLRRAVYYGPYIELLDKLAENQDLQCIRKPDDFKKNKYTLCKRESDRELILRAFAWAHISSKYKSPMKTFLNAELEHFENLEKANPNRLKHELQKYEDDFVFVMKVWRNVFSENAGAFRSWNQEKDGTWSWTKSIKPQFWDVSYVVFKELRNEFPSEAVYTRNKEKLQNAIKRLFESGELDFNGPTSVAKFIHRRTIMTKTLAAILREQQDGKRQFDNPEKLKRKLYEQQRGLCTICNQSIDFHRLDDGSYVHLDHIRPYSMGGPSIEENAALVHAACNLSKGARP